MLKDLSETFYFERMDNFYSAVEVCRSKTFQSLMSINNPGNRNDIIAALFFLAHMKSYFSGVDDGDDIWSWVGSDLKVRDGNYDENLNGFFITIVDKRVRIRLKNSDSGDLMDSLDVSFSNTRKKKRRRSVMSAPNLFESFGEAFNYIARARGNPLGDLLEFHYREAILVEEKVNFKLALMMGNHSARLGESSPLKLLAPEIICKLMTLSGYPETSDGELARCFCYFKGTNYDPLLCSF